MRYSYVVTKKDTYQTGFGKPVGVFIEKSDAVRYAALINDQVMNDDNLDAIADRYVVETPILDDSLQFGTDDIVATAIYAVQKAYDELISTNADPERK